jgi:hypothetical protein
MESCGARRRRRICGSRDGLEGFAEAIGARGVDCGGARGGREGEGRKSESGNDLEEARQTTAPVARCVYSAFGFLERYVCMSTAKGAREGWYAKFAYGGGAVAAAGLSVMMVVGDRMEGE